MSDWRAVTNELGRALTNELGRAVTNELGRAVTKELGLEVPACPGEWVSDEEKSESDWMSNE